MPGTSTILALVGATGVGKTAAAIELCRRIDGEIVGADSVQVYRGFDVGSGKPTPTELGGVRHHLIDVCEPSVPMDAAQYAGMADAAIADICERGKTPVVVGGTGLWLRALLRGLVAAPPVDHGLRSTLEQQWRQDEGLALYARMAQVDPASAATIHRNDMVRVVRALEYHAQTGRPLGEVRREHALGEPRFRCLTFWLERPRTAWDEAISARIDAMLAAGWVDEVRRIIAQHGPQVRPLGAVGYRAVTSHVLGDTSEEKMRAAIERTTRLYGKRQRTWFKGDPSVDIQLSPESLFEAAPWTRIMHHLK